MFRFTYRKLLLLLATSMAVAANVYTQPADSASYLRPGLWALEFGIGNNFTLTTFRGSTISLKYGLSETEAIRAAVTFDGNYSDGTDGSHGTNSDSTLNAVTSDRSSRFTRVDISLQYLWYMKREGSIHAYIGVGPDVSYWFNKAENEAIFSFIPSNGWARSATTSNSKRWGAGVSGAAGVEWFACRWLSIHAEYGEGVEYFWTRSETAQRSSSSPSGALAQESGSSSSSKGWSVYSRGVTFGISVYF